MAATNKCKLCEHQWISRVEYPVECPRCKRRDWNEEQVVQLSANYRFRYVKAYPPAEFELEDLRMYFIATFDSKWGFDGPSSYYHCWNIKDREALRKIWFEMRNDMDSVKNMLHKAIEEDFRGSGLKINYLANDWRKYARPNNSTPMDKEIPRDRDTGRKLRDKNSY